MSTELDKLRKIDPNFEPVGNVRPYDISANKAFQAHINRVIEIQAECVENQAREHARAYAEIKNNCYE